MPIGDRRLAGARQPMEAIGLITEIDGDKRLEVSIVNISPHGCGFRSPVPFPPGAIYTMRIGTGPLYLASTLQIVSSRERSDGCFDVGAKFA
jgi:PilZ domain